MNTKRTCAVVQLPSAESVPRTPAEVVDFAPGIDWTALSKRLPRAHVDALFAAWALRSIIGDDESPVPFFELAELTGFDPERLAEALAELARIKAIAIGGYAETVRMLYAPGFITRFYEFVARGKGGRS